MSREGARGKTWELVGEKSFLLCWGAGEGGSGFPIEVVSFFLFCFAYLFPPFDLALSSAPMVMVMDRSTVFKEKSERT